MKTEKTELVSQLALITDINEKLNFLSQQVRVYAQGSDMETLAWLYEQIACTCLEMGWYEEAMEAASRIVYLFQDHDIAGQLIDLCNTASTLYHTASEHHKNQYFTKEIETWKTLLSQIPKDKNAWFNLGNAHAAKYEFAQAIDAYTQAEAYDFDDDIAIYFNRAHSYEKLKQWEAAIFDYTRMLEIDIDDVRAWWNRAQVYIQLQQWKEAKNDLLQAYARGDEDSINLIHEVEGYMH